MKGFCTIFLAAVLLSCLLSSQAHGGVIYSGRINLPGGEFSIDINHDGQNDFIAQWQNAESGYVIQKVAQMRYMSEPSESGGALIPAPLTYGTVIGPQAGPQLQWYGGSCADTFRESGVSFRYPGQWRTLYPQNPWYTNGYLGFELTVGSDVFYGWMHFSSNLQGDIWLVGYAYENTPGNAYSGRGR